MEGTEPCCRSFLRQKGERYISSFTPFSYPSNLLPTPSTDYYQLEAVTQEPGHTALLQVRKELGNNSKRMKAFADE